MDPGEGWWIVFEAMKLAAAVLTPVAVIVLGYRLDRRLRSVEVVQRANQTVVTRRIEIFSVVTPKLNQLFCFGTFVGSWKQITPDQAILLKRQLDETMYANRVLFSNELFAAYEAFMLTLFDTYARADEDAPLRSPISSPLGDRRKMDWWRDEMATRFDTERPTSAREIKQAYRVLGERWRADLYVTRASEPLLTP
ncbi:hypothetical protein [Mycobacterium spongiae]|uniref:DUF4760 domain-containing protein n=1 Tax=Mycobacterium spongiae TaxID=886343 RepID=A0A975PXI2_9MYCO|nr:hypothetical protein [Mycobacterium spongiae]QUR68127.1 hypothetical protein F6B93_14445 [Mycobacterium spongiae]